MGFILQVACILVLSSHVFGVKQPCCYSNRFNCKMYIDTTVVPDGSMTPHFTQNRFSLDYDANMKMIAVRGRVEEISGNQKNSTDYTAVIDYNNGTQHSFNDAANNTYCVKMDVDPNSFLGPCVPQMLKWTGSVRVGSGPETMWVDGWEGMTQDGFTHSMYTTIDGCVPVTYSKYGMKDGNRIMEFGFYVDMERDVFSEPNPFMLPDTCNN